MWNCYWFLGFILFSTKKYPSFFSSKCCETTLTTPSLLLATRKWWSLEVEFAAPNAKKKRSLRSQVGCGYTLLTPYGGGSISILEGTTGHYMCQAHVFLNIHFMWMWSTLHFLHALSKDSPIAAIQRLFASKHYDSKELKSGTSIDKSFPPLCCKQIAHTTGRIFLAMNRLKIWSMTLLTA